MRNEMMTIDSISQQKDASSVIERIETHLSAAPVVLYMKGTPDFPQCGFSARVVGALRASGAQFAHHNIYEDPEVRQVLKIYSNWPTFPQLYANVEFVGGCDIVMEMHQSGELKQLLIDAGAAGGEGPTGLSQKTVAS
jgi:monothiol glutaredoxin